MVSIEVKRAAVSELTANFDAAVKEFLDKDALIQLPRTADKEIVPGLVDVLRELLSDTERREALGSNALAAMHNNRGAVAKTIEYLSPLLEKRENQ